VGLDEQPAEQDDEHGVTAAEPQAFRTSGRHGARRAAKAGQTAIVTAPSTVQARCRGVEPLAGSGDAAMPMPARPATISSTRADVRTPVRPAAVTR